MITLITAVPGSGKTLTAIQIIYDALKSGRPVYCNINGLVKDKFPNPHNLHDAPNDWRDTPEGSLVIYDECQQPHLYPSDAKRGVVSDERLTAMETHRHTGHDLVFITQAPTFVHHHVRKLVGEHIHLYRGRGLSGATRYEWSHVCDSPNDRKEQLRANSFFWKFPKEHFAFYSSATMHTHKFKLPKKITILLSLILIGSCFIIYRMSSGLESFDNSSDNGAQIATSSPAPVQAPVSPAATRYELTNGIEKALPLGGCIARSSGADCMCFSPDGYTLDISIRQCLDIISRPLPRTIVSSKNTHS